MADVLSALEDVGGNTNPHGLLRIAVTSIAEEFLSGPLIASFAAAHPNITIDVTVTDDTFDIVAAGFDAGVRLGDVIEQDMVAIPLSGEKKEVVVATPEYFEIHGIPGHPRELIHHRCIGWRPSPDTAPYRWEFVHEGVAFDVSVEPQITTNDLRLMIRTALAGGGITFALEETFHPYLERGELISVLEDYLPPFPGFFLYFPNRHHMAPKLRALVDHVQRSRRELSRTKTNLMSSA
jgi:DNA-binding transcriptional LysR family regulator